MDTMGTVYTGLGLYPQAIPLIRQSLQKRKSLAGDTTVAIAKGLGHLGEALMMNADYDEATKRLQDALAIQRKVLGNTHADVANTLSALADVMSATGEYDKGQPLIEEALRIRRKLYGEVHPDVAKSLGDLGVNFGERGDYQAGGDLPGPGAGTAAQAASEPASGPFRGHQQSRLGVPLASANSKRPSRSIARPSTTTGSSWATRIRRLRSGSTTSPIVLETRRDFRGAEKAYRESLEINRKRLGAIHPDDRDRHEQPGLRAVREGRSPAGDPDAARFDRDEPAGTRRRPSGRRGRRHEPRLLADLGPVQYDEAEKLLDEALAIRRKALGNDHPQVASTLTVKANLLVARKQYAEGARGHDRGAQDPRAQPARRSLAGCDGEERAGRGARGPRPVSGGRKAPARRACRHCRVRRSPTCPSGAARGWRTCIRRGANRKKRKSTPARLASGSHNTACGRVDPPHSRSCARKVM